MTVLKWKPLEIAVAGFYIQ